MESPPGSGRRERSGSGGGLKLSPASGLRLDPPRSVEATACSPVELGPACSLRISASSRSRSSAVRGAPSVGGVVIWRPSRIALCTASVVGTGPVESTTGWPFTSILVRFSGLVVAASSGTAWRGAPSAGAASAAGGAPGASGGGALGTSVRSLETSAAVKMCEPPSGSLVLTSPVLPCIQSRCRGRNNTLAHRHSDGFSDRWRWSGRSGALWRGRSWCSFRRRCLGGATVPYKARGDGMSCHRYRGSNYRSGDFRSDALSALAFPRRCSLRPFLRRTPLAVTPEMPERPCS